MSDADLKPADIALVNSSFTAFYIIATFVLALAFVGSFKELTIVAWIIIVAYTLLTYFIWDYIRQFYSAGMAVTLYFVTFSLLPLVITWLTGELFSMAGLIVGLAAYIVAGIAEILYESAMKRVIPRRTMAELLFLDHEIDKSMINFHNTTLRRSGFLGTVIVSVLIAAYCVVCYVLPRI